MHLHSERKLGHVKRQGNSHCRAAVYRGAGRPGDRKRLRAGCMRVGIRLRESRFEMMGRGWGVWGE
jgi:hypothetical protein